MEALTRAGAKENGPTASSAPSATASAPARLRAVRRFMGAGKSIDDFLLARRLGRDEPGSGHGRDDPRGCRHSGQPGQSGGPFGLLFLDLIPMTAGAVDRSAEIPRTV